MVHVLAVTPLWFLQRDGMGACVSAAVAERYRFAEVPPTNTIKAGESTESLAEDQLADHRGFPTQWTSAAAAD